MQRFLASLLAFCLVFSFSACKSETNDSPPAEQSTSEAHPETESSTAPSLVQTDPAVEADVEQLYSYLKNWVIENGMLNGDYVIHSKSADHYGGYEEENFNLAYWGDTDTVEFCLHSVLDDNYSISFYLSIPKSYTGTYEYITSYYERATGIPVCESTGIIDAKTFTRNYPLTSTDYYGPTELQDQFMELSRVGLCDAIGCLREFLQVEDTGYTLEDLGFERFGS